MSSGKPDCKKKRRAEACVLPLSFEMSEFWIIKNVRGWIQEEALTVVASTAICDEDAQKTIINKKH